jgi:hypothetical protein
VDWDALNGGLEVLGTTLEAVGMVAEALTHGLGALYETIRFLLPILHLPGMPGMDGTDSRAQAQAEASNRNTEALWNNTRALTNARQVYNGGPNARGSVNSGYFVPGGGAAQGQNMGQIPLG